MRDFPLLQIPGAVMPLSSSLNIIPLVEVNMATENSTGIEAVLADLIAKRDRFNVAIEALQALQGNTSITPSSGNLGMTGAVPTVRSDEFFAMTVLEGAKKFLGMAKRPQNARAIMEALQKGGYLFSSDNPMTTVASVLNRALDGGGVVRTGKGMFGLAEWYPGRVRKPRQNGEGDVPETSPADGSDLV